MGRKRSEDAIIFKVLETCTIGATKTDIVYGVKLNFRTVVPYLDMLNKEALIEPIKENPEGPIRYKTTSKGSETIEALKNVSRLLGRENDLN